MNKEDLLKELEEEFLNKEFTLLDLDNKLETILDTSSDLFELDLKEYIFREKNEDGTYNGGHSYIASFENENGDEEATCEYLIDFVTVEPIDLDECLKYAEDTFEIRVKVTYVGTL